TLNAEKKATDLSNNQLKALLSALSGDSDSRKSLVSETEERITALKSELTENEKEKKNAEKQASDIRDEINKAVSERLELEGKQNKAGKLAQEKNDAIIDLERKKAKAEQKKAASESEEKQIIDRLWENYELSHSKALEIRQPIGSISSATREVNAIKREMASLGTPNLGAIDEYARVSERYDFLTSQRDDIEKAEKELRGIISDITSEMKKVFRERFREIDDAFRTTFTEMFGGGKAELILEDEEDVLNCGIDIRAQPPGKKLSTISLLSGGEMAFVAIALYFAILKVRPTPFCVMDEIEAALDEANVSRFASYLRKMSGKTQFLVITHRRGTMEEADMLYGVTMQEKGVSKVLKLDLAEAEKTIEER
ncbi:MAG: chromosome segregation protein SMC, partial [Oscillospiraceae bacterium]|nr:chromosome segregation protein SMC [Oscillospiraceae bacterium]